MTMIAFFFRSKTHNECEIPSILGNLHLSPYKDTAFNQNNIVPGILFGKEQIINFNIDHHDDVPI